MRSEQLRRDTSSRALIDRALELAQGRSSEAAATAAMLGDDHGLVRTLDLLLVLRRQLLATSLPLAAGVAALAAGRPWGTDLTAAAGAVALLLTLSICKFRSTRHQLALDLILAGQVQLPVRAVSRELDRLGSLRTRTELAHALERLVAAAENWPSICRNARPVFDVRQVRTATPALLEIAQTLRAQPVPPRACARIERLLTDGTSPLYGSDPTELRDELNRIRHECEPESKG
jgi:hypothetical protein